MSVDEKKPEKISVSLDTRRTEELTRENEQLKQKLRDIGEKDLNKDDNDLLEHKVQAFKKFNDPHILDCQTQEELSNYVTDLINDALKNKQPSGSAPANSAQYGQKKDDLFTHHYSDFGEMTKDLVERMHDSSATEEQRKEAESYYLALLKKWVQTRKREPNAVENFYNPNLPENLPDLKDFHGFKVPENPEEGDLGKLQKMWREKRNQKGIVGQQGQGERK